MFLGEYNVDQITMKNKLNMIWVYTKNKIKILGNLKWNEKFYVTCHFSQKTAVKMVVDTAIYNTKKELVAYSKVEVCMLSLEHFRIARITDDLCKKKVKIQPSKIEFDFEKLDTNDTKLVEKLTIKSTSIDYCIHTNNVEYIRFILDTYKVSELIEKPIKGLEIHYLGQTLEGQTLNVSKITQEDRDLFLLTDEAGKQKALECSIER